MNTKQNFIEAVREKYLIPQNKKWKRVIDSLAAFFCFVGGLIGLYLLQTQPGGKLPNVSNLIVWGYIISSLPLAYLLYRESDLKKIERFILLSTMSLLFSVMAAFIKI